MIAAGLAAAFLIAAPVTAIVAGNWAYAASVRLQHTEQARWHRATAILLTQAPHPSLAAYGGFATPETRAHWLASDGRWHDGEVIAPAGAPAGSTVPIWVDQSGNLAAPPLQNRQVAGQAALASLLAPAALALVFGCVWMIARRLMDRRRLAAWESAWHITGPRWNTRR